MTTLQKRQPLVLIKASEIRHHYSMSEAIDAMEEAFVSLSSGKCFVPLRYVTTMAEGQLHLLLKPVAVDEQKRAALKILTQKEMGAVRGVPAIVGVVMVMNTQTGEILSLMDGEYITALRTGAASGLATRYFAREDAQTVAIFGCGAQGRTQLEAVANERNISKVWVFDRSLDAVTAFTEEMRKKIKAEILPGADNKVLQECDIICTATNAESPLFYKDELKPGVHINAIGSFKPNMQELDPHVFQDALIYVDQREACLSESGDFIKPEAKGLFKKDQITGEIGEYGAGKVRGRHSDNETTVFKSVGVAIQDFVVANRIYEKALEQSFGQNVRLFE